MEKFYAADIQSTYLSENSVVILGFGVRNEDSFGQGFYLIQLFQQQG